MQKEDIEKLENLGYVSDSKKLRQELILLLNNGNENLDVIQSKLKQIKKDGKKIGLFTREELIKKEYTLEQAIAIAEKKKIKYAYYHLIENLPKKNPQKGKKI